MPVYGKRFSCNVPGIDGSVSGMSHDSFKNLEMLQERGLGAEAQKNTRSRLIAAMTQLYVQSKVQAPACRFSSAVCSSLYHASSIHGSLILANTKRLTYSTKYVTG